MYNYLRQQCPPNTFTYRIKLGDNYYRLAMRFNTTVDALKISNPRVNPFRLQIGQSICIPRQRFYPVCPRRNYYTIRPGDTLYGIAQRFNVPLEILLRANAGINPNLIFVGDVICIPLETPPVACPPNTVSYFIRPEDTFYSIAQNFNTTVSALIQANPDIKYDALLVGQRICIPQATEDLPETKAIPVIILGETENRNARLRRSEQGYYIYVLDNYEFFSEEPGSDVLLYQPDDNFFLRIEKLDESSDIRDLKQNALQFLENTGTPSELSGPQILDPFFRTNKFFLSAYNEEISVNIFVKEIDGALLRFTMFLPNKDVANEVIPSFFAMLKTIEII